MSFTQSVIDVATRVARREVAAAGVARGGWGTVTGVLPLAVTLDESSSGAMGVTPVSLVDGLTEGDRVWVEHSSRRAVIIGAAHTAPPPVTPSPATLRVATYNLKHAEDSDESWTSSDTAPNPDHPDGGNRRWSIRRPYAAANVIASGAEIVALQECSWIGQPENQAWSLVAAIRATAPTGTDWQTVPTAATAPSSPRFGVALIYDRAKWEWIDGGRAKNPAFIAELMWGLFMHRATGQRVIVASDHWHAELPAQRAVQSRAARAFLGHLQRRYRVAVILGVDTNDYAQAGEPDITAFTRGGAFRRIETAYPSASGLAPTKLPTWNDWRPSAPWPASGQSAGEWLDQIFTSAGCTVTAGGIHGIQPGNTFTTPLGSDHHLMAATVTLTVDDGTGPKPYDTGWLPHGGTLGAGVTASVPVMYRIIDGVVFWRGAIDRAAGFATGYWLTNIAPDVYPTTAHAAPLMGNPAAGVTAGGWWPDLGGSLYGWVHGSSLNFVAIGGSYPIG